MLPQMVESTVADFPHTQCPSPAIAKVGDSQARNAVLGGPAPSKSEQKESISPNAAAPLILAVAWRCSHVAR